MDSGCKTFVIIVLGVVVGILLAAFILWLVSSPDFWIGFCRGAPRLCTPPTPTPVPYYVPGQP